MRIVTSSCPGAAFLQINAEWMGRFPAAAALRRYLSNAFSEGNVMNKLESEVLSMRSSTARTKGKALDFLTQEMAGLSDSYLFAALAGSQWPE